MNLTTTDLERLRRAKTQHSSTPATHRKRCPYCHSTNVTRRDGPPELRRDPEKRWYCAYCLTPFHEHELVRGVDA